MCDLFYTLEYNVVNYADDNTPYAMENSTEEVIRQLENAQIHLLSGFLKIF